MKKAVMIKVLCACTLLLAPMIIHAQTDEKPSGKPGKQHHIWADLGLTEEQSAKLKQLHQEIKTARKKNFEAARTIHAKIREELLKEKPSTAQLDTYASELGEIHKQIAQQHNNHLLKVKTVLTAEQFLKIVNKEGDHFGKYWMKNRGGPHDGPCKKEHGEKGKSCHKEHPPKNQPPAE